MTTQCILSSLSTCLAQYDCPVVEAILDYAKANLVMFNIFIKVGPILCFRKKRSIVKRILTFYKIISLGMGSILCFDVDISHYRTIFWEIMSTTNTEVSVALV